MITCKFLEVFLVVSRKKRNFAKCNKRNSKYNANEEIIFTACT